jgi:hypothetical protein
MNLAASLGNVSCSLSLRRNQIQLPLCPRTASQYQSTSPKIMSSNLPTLRQQLGLPEQDDTCRNHSVSGASNLRKNHAQTLTMLSTHRSPHTDRNSIARPQSHRNPHTARQSSRRRPMGYPPANSPRALRAHRTVSEGTGQTSVRDG